MRSIKSMRNMLISILANVIVAMVGFITQKIFIGTLGDEFLGVNGLFSNIISMLAIAELGVGTAIVYNMYKPIANQDDETIKSLLRFYKRCYQVIAIIVLLIGLLIIPFLPFIVGEVTISDNLICIYSLFLIDVVLSYLLIYKRSILDANQGNYICQLIHVIYVIVLNAVQIALLLVFKNYYYYLGSKVLFRLLENYTISKFVDLKYPFVKDRNVLPLNGDIKKDIICKVKAIVFHKIGGFAILGSDNILISMLINVTSVGYYSNYKMIIGAVQNLFLQAFTSLNASVGNLLVTDKEKSYEIYKKLEFLNFGLSTFTSSCLLIIMECFIEIWLGPKYILSSFVLIMLVANYYLQTMRAAMGTFKEAAGIFYEDRFIPFVELICNIIFSILFSGIFGLAGIFMGTVISNFVLHFYSFPKYCYKNIFAMPIRRYFQLIFKYFASSILICGIAWEGWKYCAQHIYSVYLQFFISTIYAMIIPKLILFVIFRKTEEFKFYKSFICNIVGKLKN